MARSTTIGMKDVLIQLRMMGVLLEAVLSMPSAPMSKWEREAVADVARKLGLTEAVANG